MANSKKNSKPKENLNTKEKKGLDISAKTFIVAIVVLFALMVVTYILTFIIPGGQYAKTLDSAGNSVIDMTQGFQFVDGGIPFWKWILSPILVLGANGNTTLISILAFLIIIGGVFAWLDKTGFMRYMLDKIVYKFGDQKYKLMAIIMFFFMAMGSFIGSFEEVIPLVPIIVALSLRFGWDKLTGLGMSLLAVGCGFATGVCNPFTVGVAQTLAGLPMFSGMWYRAVAFVPIYFLVLFFVRYHAKKVEKPVLDQNNESEFQDSKEMNSALKWFAIILIAGMATIISSGVITALQPYNMIVVSLAFLIGGIVASLIVHFKGKEMAKTFFDGAVSLLPAAILILMAASIKYTMEEAKILDTVLYYAVDATSSMSRVTVLLFLYLIVLVMNFFIGSGSAKAFLLIPLMMPIAQIFNIPAQLCIMAFAFGDGFSNVFYPTNPVLLIGTGLANVSYGKWVKWTWKFQAMNLILTSGLLLLGLAIGYQ